jgi:hypothetical protein
MAKGKSATSGYTAFSKELRPKLREQDPSLTFGQLSKTIGERWKALSDAEKAVYIEQAASKRGFKKGGK